MFTGLLAGKTILLGVTGSISIYKSLELIRLFSKAGAQVKVVMSESAKKFITPLTFEAISANAVLHEESENWHSNLNHIGYAQESDLFVIAPASANTINSLANGIGTNLLLQCVLANPNKLLIAPSANTFMYQNAVTTNSLQRLKKQGVIITKPQVKMLACQTEGDGALAEVEEIFFQSAKALLETPKYLGKDVVITGGGTIEKIDDVRYLSNFSSGKMASSLALAFYLLGANVTLIATRFPNLLPLKMNTKTVQSTQEMYKAVQESLKGLKDAIFISAAAVADYAPKSIKGKLKKSQQLTKQWSLELFENTDILKSIDKTNLTAIGFKAEMDKENALAYAKEMLTKKELAAVCLNILEDDSSFGSDDNTITFLTKEGQKQLATADKLSLSFNIAHEIASL